MDDMPWAKIPFQSVFTEEILPSGMKGRFIDDLFNILCQEGFYRVDRGTWSIECEGLLPPTADENNTGERGITALFETIVRFVDAVPEGPGQHLNIWALEPRKWVAHGPQLIDQRRKPDIVLLGHGADKGSDVASAGDFKYQNAGRLAKRASEQVVDTAFSVFSSQINRQSFVAFSLCDPTLRVYVYTRDGDFELEPIDIHKEHTAFLRFVILLTYGAPRWLGYDPNFHVFEDRVSVRFRGKWLPVVSILFHSHGVQGRGTRILVVKRDDYYLVLKDSWVSCGMPTDGDIHELLQNRERSGVTEPNGDLLTNLIRLNCIEAAHAYLLDSEKNLEYLKFVGYGRQPISQALFDSTALSMTPQRRLHIG
ncbi:hypothetical protein EDD15DRAFT_935265 [Pisolithus albus]|nr:hypothetical protein EDD15DRAFT_935265 [Pisolithus albus]